MNWRKIFKQAKKQELIDDFNEVAELVRKLYLIFDKNGCYKKKR